jgi:hypothetical protein
MSKRSTIDRNQSIELNKETTNESYQNDLIIGKFNNLHKIDMRYDDSPSKASAPVANNDMKVNDGRYGVIRQVKLNNLFNRIRNMLLRRAKKK